MKHAVQQEAQLRESLERRDWYRLIADVLTLPAVMTGVWVHILRMPVPVSFWLTLVSTIVALQVFAFAVWRCPACGTRISRSTREHCLGCSFRFAQGPP